MEKVLFQRDTGVFSHDFVSVFHKPWAVVSKWPLVHRMDTEAQGHTARRWFHGAEPGRMTAVRVTKR